MYAPHRIQPHVAAYLLESYDICAWHFLYDFFNSAKMQQFS